MAAVSAGIIGLAPPPIAGTASPAAGCPGTRIAVADGCARPVEVRGRVLEIARKALDEHGLRAVILRADRGGTRLARGAFGESMAGVPAIEPMHFRIGSMAIPYLAILLLQLQDAGRLSLDDPLATWLPGFPNADRVTLRMLLNNTSGYPDWIQGNQAFVDLLLADVFRQWTPDELIAHAFARPLACDPGTCFNYAHTNYAIVSMVLRAVTGKSVATLMHRRIFRPLGLRETRISAEPRIPEPVLHAYTSDRGVYEDSTYWSPSWTIGEGTIMTSTINDIARAARAIGTGRLISRRALAEQFAPPTVGTPGFTAGAYFALGIIVSGGWRLQNPMLNGYTGIMASLPAEKLAIAVTVTTDESSSRDGRNYSVLVFNQIAAYLAPDHPTGLRD